MQSRDAVRRRYVLGAAWRSSDARAESEQRAHARVAALLRAEVDPQRDLTFERSAATWRAGGSTTLPRSELTWRAGQAPTAAAASSSATTLPRARWLAALRGLPRHAILAGDAEVACGVLTSCAFFQACCDAHLIFELIDAYSLALGRLALTEAARGALSEFREFARGNAQLLHARPELLLQQLANAPDECRALHAAAEASA